MTENQAARRPVVALDLDGVLCPYDGWKGLDHFNDPFPGAVEFTRELAQQADILIFTSRCCAELRKPMTANFVANTIVREWLNKHGFVYHDIWIGEGKPAADWYIDDRALPCRPAEDPTAFAKALRWIQTGSAVDETQAKLVEAEKVFAEINGELDRHKVPVEEEGKKLSLLERFSFLVNNKALTWATVGSESHAIHTRERVVILPAEEYDKLREQAAHDGHNT